MDLKMLKQFHRGYLLGKQPQTSRQGGLSIMPVYEYLFEKYMGICYFPIISGYYMTFLIKNRR